MKDFLVRLLLAAAVVLTVLAVAPADAQHSGPAPTGAQQQVPSAPKQDAESHSSENTQEALTFSGRVVKEKGRVLLKDPVTKMNYQLDDQQKAVAFLGLNVKVTGKLNLNSNEIYIDSIEPAM